MSTQKHLVVLQISAINIDEVTALKLVLLSVVELDQMTSRVPSHLKYSRMRYWLRHAGIHITKLSSLK